jgi:hypothetical protein
MKKETSSRRGSALLIVLGMLSFMIVSAVAFSVYMRMSRAPSSFLRRNIATSDLVKAALARAIEDIDDKIGNDIYPGVGPNATEIRDYTSYEQWRYSGYEDAWVNRVFCPYSNNQGETQVNKTGNRNSSNNSILEFDDTAAVLTLEGLGYIPAPLVNQARYWSRRSMTARWKRFNYDLGRWAYTAINVSDLLDVNTLRAYTNRNSGAFGRLSLSAAVKNAKGDPQQFDNFVKTRGGTENQVPFTSVMDFNLALQSSGPVESPFYEWITKGGNNGFYGNASSNQIAPLVFLTDSWYPTTNAFRKGYNPNNDQSYYLSRADDQPFLRFNNTKGMLEFFKNGNPAGAGDSLMDFFAPQIRAAGVACLYDYLDKDSVPTSLVLPCTEQVPMIIGVCPIIQSLQFNVLDNETPPAQGANPQVTKHELTLALDSIRGQVDVAFLFPFKRLDSSRAPGNFRVQAMLRIYLGPKGGMPLRASDNNSNLHPQPTSGTWSQGTTFKDNIYTVVTAPQNVMPPNASSFNTGDESEAIVDHVRIQLSGGDNARRDFFTWTSTVTVNQNTGLPGTPVEKIDKFDFSPYSANGTSVALAGFSALGQGLMPNVSVWLRVVDSNDKTVDLAPATLQDDNLNWSLGLSPSQSASVGGTICGTGVPLLNFRTKTTSGAYLELPVAEQDIINWSKTQVATAGTPVPGIGQSDDSEYGTLYCYDPRYNFAPEDWYSTTDKGVDADKWLDQVKNNLLGQDGRDSDIFMFVSNQEYLQSMGELAFLPRTQDLVWNDPGGGIMQGTFFNAGRYNGNSVTFAVRKDFNVNNAANGVFFWRTYRSYSHDGVKADPIYYFRDSAGNGIYDDEGAGPRVNPFTEDPENVFLAAIADTPCDYWAASTNKSLGTQYANNFASNPSEALKHCFNNDSPLSKVTDQEIRAIANVIRNKIRSGGADWLGAYDDLDWYGNGDPQCFLNDVGDTKATKNMTQTAINEVDRKFLYSFWRNCFGNRQQLFIVFVRAEPSVLGGAQQGGRAVALVWRDPEAPVGFANRKSRQDEKRTGTNTNMLPPHRTRVLFYHQFE